MSDYTSWHVGMKVVCVDDAPTFGHHLLAKGHVYTIASIGHATGIFKDRCVRNELVVALEEVRAICRDGTPHDSGFAASRFRPVQTRKTDISIFTALLHRQSEDA